MTSADIALVPNDQTAIARFGKGDSRKFKSHLLMLAAFLEGKPVNTRRTYRTALRQFFDTFEWICPEDVTVAHAVLFKKTLLKRGVSDATAYCRLSALSSYFDFLRMPQGANDEPLIKSNPFDVIPRNDIKPTPYGRAMPVEWKTFKTILDSLPTDPVGLRDRAILIFFAFTGRRRAEVASLMMKDLNLQTVPRSYTCRVKGGALKSFELPKICYDALKVYWIAANRLNHLHAEAGVFSPARECNITTSESPDRPLSTRMMNKILRRAALNAGVDITKVRLHGLRHMAARDLDRAGLRLQDIQEFLGHANPNTTAIYLQKLAGPAKSHEDVLSKIRAAAADLGRAL